MACALIQPNTGKFKKLIFPFVVWGWSYGEWGKNENKKESIEVAHTVVFPIQTFWISLKS